MSMLLKFTLIAIWLLGAVIFIGLLAWQIQRRKKGWIVFNGTAATLYLLAAIYFATQESQ